MKKILSAALALVCIWFASPAFANCNLFDESQILNTNGFSINENGYYNGSFYDWAKVRFSFDNAFKENTQYTLSFNGYVSDSAAIFSFSYTDGTGGSCAIRATQATDYTCTTEPNKTLSNISTTYGSGVNTVYVKNIQLEEGTTATPYQPYDANCVDPCANMFNMDWLLNAGGWTKNDGVYTGTNGTQYGYAKDGYPITFAPNTQYIITGHFGNNPGFGRFEVVYTDNTTRGIGFENTDFFVKTYPGKSVKSLRFNYANSGVMEVSNIQVKPAYCSEITIATTKYNETKFSPLNTALANAISVVDSVVSNTITQAGRIATLQAQKQTRPNDIADDNEKCPAGKKCLLVEDASGVPHWYEIVEQYSRLPEGFTELQYVSNAANTYLDTGIIPTVDNVVMEMKVKPSTGSWYIWQNRDPSNSVIHGFSGANTGSKISFNFPNASVATSTITRTGNILTMRSTMLNGQGKLYVHDDATNESDEQTIAYTFSAETLPYYLFGNQRSDTVNSGNVVYYAKMYMNDELVMDYIPAKRNRDGAIGFYDLASQSFKQANHGSFIAGPEVQ